MKKVMLFSGGQDSVTVLFAELAAKNEVVAVSIDYGQRHRAELEAAAAIVARLPRVWVRHVVLRAPVLAEVGGNALVDPTQPLAAAGGMMDRGAPRGLPTTYVAARNLLFLTLVLTIAVKERRSTIVAGFCQTDYSGYPDCKREFVDSFEKTATLALPSMAGPIRVETPLMHLTKAETVRMARNLPGCWEALALSVTCYEGQRPGCGKCPSCVLRAKGFAESGEKDPAFG